MKKKIVIGLMCAVALTGIVYAATGPQMTSTVSSTAKSSQSGKNVSKGSSVTAMDAASATAGVTTGAMSSTGISTYSTGEVVSAKSVNSEVMSGNLIPFEDVEYTNDFQQDEANYQRNETDADYDNGNYTNSAIAGEAGNTIEFVTYSKQELDAVYSSFIVTNLSSNQYDMNFYLYKDNKLIASEEGVKPGDAKSIELAKLLGKGEYTICLVSEAVASSGVVLDSLEQDVSVSVTSIDTSSITSGEEKSNQASGSTYDTAIVYDAETMQCSVQMPAVLSIAKGEIGTDFDVSYRLVGVKTGTKFSLTATNGLDKDSAIKLITNSGANGDISTVNANLKMGDGNSLDYVLDTTGSVLHTVGPIHCFMSNDKLAKENYYGTTRFKLTIEEG